MGKKITSEEGSIGELPNALPDTAPASAAAAPAALPSEGGHYTHNDQGQLVPYVAPVNQE